MGDTDPASKVLVVGGMCPAVVTTAAGYVRRRKGDSLAAVDDQGNRTLDEALAIVRPFLDPLLQNTASGSWRSDHRAWA